MSISINIGKYGGFYIYWGYTKRICLGWLAITFYPFDLDDYFTKNIQRDEGQSVNSK